MIYFISPTTLQSKALHWYTITDKVDQIYDATTTQNSDLIHSFKKIGYNCFLGNVKHNLHQVYGEGYFNMPNFLLAHPMP